MKEDSDKNTGPELSTLDLTILKELPEGKNLMQIASITGVSIQVIEERLHKLFTQGYLTDSHALTKKGQEALSQ
jgi:predicted transcriptional regulator